MIESIYRDLAEDVIVQYTSLLQDWTPQEATIAIAVENNYVYYAPQQVDIQISIGQSIAPTSIAQLVYESGRKVEQTIDNPYGSGSYHGIGYPITVREKKGALLIVLPNRKKEKTLYFITGRNEDEWQPIPIEDVSFFESLNKKNWCCQQNELFQISLTMKDLANRLPEYFIRIHRSYIINIRNISKITRDFASNLLIVMKDGKQLPVSQSYVTDLRKTLEF